MINPKDLTPGTLILVDPQSKGARWVDASRALRVISYQTAHLKWFTSTGGYIQHHDTSLELIWVERLDGSNPIDPFPSGFILPQML